MEKELIPSSPSLSLAVERSLADFVNQQGSQKIYSILECIEMIRQYVIVNKGEEFLINLLEKELANYKISKIKTYKDLDEYLIKIRKRFINSQILYENSKNSKEKVQRENYRKEIARKTSPFYSEIYFIFMVLLKISAIQNRIISRELLKSPEEFKSSSDNFARRNKGGIVDGSNRIIQN